MCHLVHGIHSDMSQALREPINYADWRRAKFIVDDRVARTPEQVFCISIPAKIVEVQFLAKSLELLFSFLMKVHY